MPVSALSGEAERFGRGQGRAREGQEKEQKQERLFVSCQLTVISYQWKEEVVNLSYRSNKSNQLTTDNR